MTGTTAGQARVLAGHARFLITAAARAPSVHNTQPWRFRVGPDVVELWTDPEPPRLGVMDRRGTGRRGDQEPGVPGQHLRLPG